jgi:crotonobetainyl-CoA:carnitine CoA-transferase CaiB-like acyl-CoA transferase
VGLGIRVNGCAETYRFAPPRLGEHTDAVLRDELGLDEAQLAKLHEQQII